MILRVDYKNYEDDIEFDLNKYLQDKIEYKKYLEKKYGHSKYYNLNEYIYLFWNGIQPYTKLKIRFLEFIDFIYECTFENTIKADCTRTIEKNTGEIKTVEVEYNIRTLLNEKEYSDKFWIETSTVTIGEKKRNIYWNEGHSFEEIYKTNENKLKLEDLIKYILRKKVEEIEKIL